VPRAAHDALQSPDGAAGIRDDPHRCSGSSTCSLSLSKSGDAFFGSAGLPHELPRSGGQDHRACMGWPKSIIT
jgi:hypothetical protein